MQPHRHAEHHARPCPEREALAVVDDGVGLAREHGGAMPELEQLARQVAGVDALSPRMRVSPVGEEGDAKRGGSHREVKGYVVS